MTRLVVYRLLGVATTVVIHTGSVHVVTGPPFQVVKR